MSENEIKEAASAKNNEAKMDAIKQLIFGENMVEYDERFNTMMQKLEDTQQKLENKIADVDSAINSTISTLERTVNDTIYDLTSQFESKSTKMEERINIAFDKMDDKKTDRRALGKMLQTIGEKLQK